MVCGLSLPASADLTLGGDNYPRARSANHRKADAHRAPLAASDDKAFTALRVVTRKVSASAAPLPGAREIYSYDESAFKRLSPRFANVTSVDPYSQKSVTQNVCISDVIATQARESGIDPLIIEIIIGHESGFNPVATSNVGARGFMQLMPETAATLGVTDLDDPVQNITAGTRYFAEQYRRFGNLHLALAAYNAGPNSVTNYGGVPPYEETINYASSIAMEYESRRKKIRST